MLAPLLAAALLLGPPTLAPEKASKLLAARNLGLAELEEARNKEARRSFERIAELAPDEPLGWAGGAVAALRDGDLEGSGRLLERARKAGGERAGLYAIQAALEEARHRPDEARTALARAAALDPRDLESRWRFVKSVEGGEARQRALGEIVAASPANLPAHLKLLLAQMEAGDTIKAKEHAAELERLLADADARSRSFLGEARALLSKGDAKGASLKARILENLLRVTARYQQSLGELFTNVQGLPLTSFSPGLESALRPRGGTAIPVALRASSLPAEDPALTLRRVDLMNTGKAEAYAIPAPYTGAVFFDFDLDGDLDVTLFGGGAPDKLLRNNLDGTWTDVTASMGEARVTSTNAIAGDFDRDGDPDLLVLTATHELVLRSNLRQGRFRTVPVLSRVADVAVDDLDADGTLDLVVAGLDGKVSIHLGSASGFAGAGETLSGLPERAPTRLLLADLDNDGFPDLVVFRGPELFVFRNRGNGSFDPWAIAPRALAHPVERAIALDIDHDGDLDLVLAGGGKVSVFRNDGGNANAWLDVVVEGLTTGSGKVNKAGVGSLVEVKAGRLYVARTVGILPTHAGLGAEQKADVVRCVFTNGIPQNLFDQRARTVVKEIQQLKGSCPFVYAHNGETGVWSFVSDALGRAPIGLLYDGVHLAGADPREWLFIDGSLLAPSEGGRLLLDYTEELWEAAYLDEATLMAVDHPGGTAVVPNERTIPGLLTKKLFTVALPRPPRGAWSEGNGKTADVLDRIAGRDEVYVDPGSETRYQGIRDEHALILDLGPVKAGDRVVLFLNGWILYTDTSINVSVSQRGDVRPFAPVLEVPDGHGGWRVAMPSFGFPAGKTKTMPVDLTGLGLLDPADPRVRIRTTMAVFWDEAFVTVNDPEVPVVATLLPPAKATLRERGFSRRYRETPDGPELFDHDDVSTGPRWEDVPGLVTRLGDVTALLTKADDRWVVMKGGDAIRIEYDASRLPPLRPGWRRDYVLVSDGWDKDFDKNTVSGQSVDPWPFHAMSAYPYPESESHPDPAFLREWLTRRAGPEAFREALRK